MKAGTPIEPVTKGPITLEMLKLYAKASGDPNPIHTDEEAARKVGLPGIIAHGMLSAGFLSDRAIRFMKPVEKNWKLTSFQSRFKSMTYLGDVVTVAGTVKSSDDHSIMLELTATNPKGEVTTLARAEFTPRR